MYLPAYIFIKLYKHINKKKNIRERFHMTKYRKRKALFMATVIQTTKTVEFAMKTMARIENSQ